jgi:hypothetical protein
LALVIATFADEKQATDVLRLAKLLTSAHVCDDILKKAREAGFLTIQQSRMKRFVFTSGTTTL